MVAREMRYAKSHEYCNLEGDVATVNPISKKKLFLLGNLLHRTDVISDFKVNV